MINRQLCILLVILICSTVFVQCKNNKNDNKSFDKIIKSFKKSYGKIYPVSCSSLYRYDDFNLSISKKTITFDTIIHVVVTMVR